MIYKNLPISEIKEIKNNKKNLLINILTIVKIYLFKIFIE